MSTYSLEYDEKIRGTQSHRSDSQRTAGLLCAVSNYTAIKKARQAEKSEREDGPCVMLI